MSSRTQSAIWFFVFLLLVILQVWTARAAPSDSDPGPGPEQMVLGIGRAKEWPAPRGLKVSISNGSIVRVQDAGSVLRITGKKSGSASVQIGSNRLDVVVLPESKFAFYERLRLALVGKRGLSIRVENSRPVIEGRLLRFDDWLALAEAFGDSSHDYEFRARPETSVIGPAEERFKSMLREAGLPDLRVNLRPDAFVTLPMEPEDLKARVTKILGPYGFKVIRSPSSLGLEPLVRVKIIVAEFKKKMMNRIGLQWPASIEGQILPSLIAPADGNLNIGINALEENGLGKILASPVLLCRSGKEAQFLAGGEFPIKIANFKQQDVIWKRYGVLLKIKPQADFSGRMSIGVATEVSTIDSSQTVDGLPGLLTNRIETHFDLSGSRTIALSGLIKKEWGDSSSGIPVLGSLPILGPLFSSQDYRDNQTELVVFVTPEVIRPDQEKP